MRIYMRPFQSRHNGTLSPFVSIFDLSFSVFRRSDSISASVMSDYRESTPSNSSSSGRAGAGVCIMNTAWKEGQHPAFIKFISSFLETNSYRLNLMPIAPDFIFNCGGVSVAFIFATNWFEDTATVVSRVQKLREQFANLYVVVVLPTKDQNDSFVRSYFKSGLEFGRPVFIPVLDFEMGFEKIVRIAHARGVCKRQDAIAKLKAEREKSVQSMDIYIKVVTSIPGIDKHDAVALHQAIGSIEAIAKASKEYILENTDLSTEKAETIARFFRDSKYYLGPKIK